MDLLTIVGLAVCGGLFYSELVAGNSLNIFLNKHGLLIVFGGTLCATLVMSTWGQLTNALHALKEVFFPSRIADPRVVIPEMVRLAEKARKDGVTSLVPQDQITGDGFLTFAIQTVLERSDAAYVREVLGDAIKQMEDRHAATAGVFQNMAVLAPMFGLLGTILGIIHVLKEIANPAAVGPAMAIAITTAFYGILMACLFCNPVVAKLRARSLQERKIKEMIAVGMIDILGGMVPLEVERHLKSFLAGRERARA